jgi:hypothetical protein
VAERYFLEFFLTGTASKVRLRTQLNTDSMVPENEFRYGNFLVEMKDLSYTNAEIQQSQINLIIANFTA